MSSSDHYYGEAAKDYEAKRSHKPVWDREQRWVKKALSESGSGSRCLDVPVGTGRFFPFYRERALEVVGVDLSHDMLSEARQRALNEGIEVSLKQASILELPFDYDSFDIAVCIRLLQWLTPDDADRAIAELARVTKGAVLVSANCRVRPRLTLGSIIRQRRKYHSMQEKRRSGKPTMHLHRRRDLLKSFARHGLLPYDEAVLGGSRDSRTYHVWSLRHA